MKTESPLSPYNPQWPGEFERIRDQFRRALGPLAINIDHIGSTSIPGMAAKDCIDIQVRCRELDAAAFDAALSEVGFTRSLNEWNRRDHLPRGWEGAPELWDKFVYQPPKDQRLSNVHVRIAGNPNARYALLFRDFLRGDARAAEAWAEFKQRLAAEMPRELDMTYVLDRIRSGGPGSAYGWIKDAATDVLMRGAEFWAEATRWDVDHA